MDIKVLIGIIVILFVISGIYLYLVKPYDVDIVYNSIKFQSGNINIEESSSIKIKGKYVRGLFGNSDKFSGQILVDDIGLNYSDNLLEFGNHNMAIQEFGPTTKGIFGLLYITEKFESMHILISESNKNFSFYYKDGWIISAPSENREDAVKISNELFKKKGSNSRIE